MLDPETGAKIGLAAWELRDRFKKATQKVRRRLNEGNLGIAIFGAGGTGKSTLGHLLDETFDPSAPPVEYRASKATEGYWLKQNDAQSLFVAPGQPERQGYWDKLLAELSRNKQILIFNVVAAGYHATETNIVDVDEYLSRCVQIEQQLVENLISAIRHFQQPIKMITVIAKQDLWVSHQSEIADFYENGKYSEAIEELKKAKGTQNFQHEFAYVSLTIQSLRDKSGNIVMPNTAGYDLTQSAASLKNLTDLIERFTP